MFSKYLMKTWDLKYCFDQNISAHFTASYVILGTFLDTLWLKTLVLVL